MNDVCDCCEQDDAPTRYVPGLVDDFIRLCDPCLDVLRGDGLIEP